MLPSSCDWRNSLHFIQQHIRNNRPTVWACTRPKIKGWSTELTQATKNPATAGLSDYYEDYFKSFPSVTSGRYTLKKALKILVVLWQACAMSVTKQIIERVSSLAPLHLKHAKHFADTVSQLISIPLLSCVSPLLKCCLQEQCLQQCIQPYHEPKLIVCIWQERMTK